ncbi:hypothetical protein NMG60_11004997 [Bertholletia excelsa]
MASSKEAHHLHPAYYYYPLPPSRHHPHPPHHHHHHHQPEQNYAVLPFYVSAAVRRQQWCRIICTATFILLAVAVYCLWPSDPDLKIVRLHLERVHISTVPVIAVDVTLGLTVRVRNVDIYSIDYRSLVVSIGYRGRELGFVTSGHGHVRPKGSSYVDATLQLDGVEVLVDVILLLEDLVRGSLQLDTVTEFRGHVGLFFFQIPVEAKVSCEIHINIRNQTVIRQNCYSE